MKDIQGQRDHRRINIKKVGVKTISYPLTVLDKASKCQRTVATVNMYVNLPHRFKGTHMSRFVEILNRFHGQIELESFHRILEEMKDRLEAEAAHVEITFPYFLKGQQRPGNLKDSRYECRMHGSLEEKDDLELNLTIPVTLPLTRQMTGSMPCSMGRWGQAHIAVRFRRFIWIEDIITMIEQSIESEQEGADPDGYPAFTVESMTKKLSVSLAGEKAVEWFSVTVENLAEGYTTYASIDSSFVKP